MINNHGEILKQATGTLDSPWQTKRECESSPGELPKGVQMHLKATFVLSAGDAHTKRRIASLCQKISLMTESKNKLFWSPYFFIYSIFHATPVLRDVRRESRETG